MLSDEEKIKIREEEIYREEVRESLFSKKKNPFFSFLDTQHGVFIASAIVLPVFMWLFTVLQTHYLHIQTTNDYIEKLDNEMTFRISNYYSHIEQGSLVHFKSQVNKSFVFPQFSGVGIQGLMLELEKNVPEKERDEILKARKSLISGNEDEVLKLINIRGWYDK